MSDNEHHSVGNAHLGRQMKRDRLARHWTLRELGARTGMPFPNLSLVETGKRPMSERLAKKCDEVFGSTWYVTEYDQSKHAIPPGLRQWSEYEGKASRLLVWSPGVIDGLLQTEAYARPYLSSMGEPPDVVDARWGARLGRQQRTLFRDDPPEMGFVVDFQALYRLTGSAEIMVDAMRRLQIVAALPNVTLQVLPAIAHPGTASELIIADFQAAYCEHLGGGAVYTEPERVRHLSRVMSRLQAACYTASASVIIIREAEESWSGESPPIQGTMGPV